MEINTVWHTLLTWYTQLLLQYPSIQTGLDFATVVMPLALLFALPGVSLMSISGQLLAVRRQRSAYDKAGRQLSMLGVGIAWLLTAGGAAMLYLQQDQTVQPMCAMVQLWSWLLVAVGAFLESLHFALWRSLRGWPRLHQMLGLFSTIATYLGGYLLLAALVAQGQADVGISPTRLKDLIIPTEDSLLWNAVYYLPVLVVAMAGGLSCLWMLLRRKRDDYGRDYYNLILPWAASWARNAWLCLWLILLFFTGWSILSEANEAIVMPMQDLINHAIRLLLWIIPLLLWGIVARSSTPLRHKLTLLLAQLLAMGFLVPFYMGLVA